MQVGAIAWLESFQKVQNNLKYLEVKQFLQSSS